MTVIKSVYLSVLAALLLRGAVAQTSTEWGQCGGQDYKGPTLCPANWTCTFSNPFYSQCLPGAATTTTKTTTTVGGGGGGSTTTSAPGGSATLAPGYSFIRAVADPNFHKYLQSQVLNTVSPAVLADYTTAAQFQITNGQLIQNAAGTPLYAVVEVPANSTVVKLGVSWSKTPDTLGTFVFSGDSVEWSSTKVKRQQNNAWLVCPSGNIPLLFINLGPFGFMTPAGCADQTIHAYTGATAVP
ncbi:carbohydrate-binding module family 1 protein [Mycena rebaudengoi]|nr:carbohydrate-binding module family 1 protein [Mycena rebaudengoi]